MGIAWIASYPKSGNTWVRFLVANYLAGPIEHSTQVEALVPDFSRPIDPAPLLAQRPTLIAKSHFRWGPDHPHAALTERAVVVLRHPKDVLLSNLAYDRLLSTKEAAYTDAQFIGAFIQAGGDPRWLSQGYGTLEEHVRSWLDAPETFPRHIVRYDDLKADTAGQFAKIAEFLGLPADPDRLKLAVSRSGFDQMRAMEVREKAAKKSSDVFAGPPPKPGKPRYFMNEGKSRRSLAHIDPALDRLFDQRFASLIERMGYADA